MRKDVGGFRKDKKRNYFFRDSFSNEITPSVILFKRKINLPTSVKKSNTTITAPAKLILPKLDLSCSLKIIKKLGKKAIKILDIDKLKRFFISNKSTFRFLIFFINLLSGKNELIPKRVSNTLDKNMKKSCSEINML